MRDHLLRTPCIMFNSIVAFRKDIYKFTENLRQDQYTHRQPALESIIKLFGSIFRRETVTESKFTDI